MYKNFLLEVGRSWISEVWNPIESSSDELKWPEKQPTPSWGTNRTPPPPSRFYGDFSKHKVVKTVADGKGK